MENHHAQYTTTPWPICPDLMKNRFDNNCFELYDNIQIMLEAWGSLWFTRLERVSSLHADCLTKCVKNFDP